MFNYVWPITLVVGSCVVYNICAKSIPGQVNPLASMIITYLSAILCTLVFFYISSPSKNLITEFKNINWSTYILGLSIVGIELGYIYLYRAGWNISIGSLVANISLAVILIIVGVLIYKEHLSINQLIGIGLCIAGLIFINKK